MAEGTEPIRQDIDALRDSMTQKMEQIESKVKGTVDTTVEQVKRTVDTTVEQVKRTFDLQQQVSERPWAALGIAFAAGYMLGTMGDGDRELEPSYRPSEPARPYTVASTSAADRKEGNDTSAASSAYTYRSEQPRQQNSFLAGIFDQFGGELNLISNAAIAAGVGMLRDSIKDTLPQFSQEYERARQQTLRSEPATGEQGASYTSSTLSSTR